MKRFLRDNGLALTFLALFVLALLGQAFAGHVDFNNQQKADGLATVSFFAYVTSSAFAVDVAENWQSEYLQFFLYVFATVWLVQRGSTESKKPGDQGRESDEEQKVGRYTPPGGPVLARMGGLRHRAYARSLGLVMAVIFFGSWLAQSISGLAAFNEQRIGQHLDPLNWLGYVTSADFWNRTLQNWQSEFLAVASIVVLSIYLRHRGSPQSKPVGTPHAETGVEG